MKNNCRGVVTRFAPLLSITAAASAVAVPPLSVQLKNQSGLPDSQVYIGFVSGGGTLNATNAATNAPLSLSTFASPNWYALNQLPAGIHLNAFSGRIYVGYGSPWTFQNAGYEPPPTVASDPNYLKRFDKMELTYNGNPADVADTTSIDYFSIPIGLKVYQGGVAGKVVGSLKASPDTATVDALRAITSPAGAAVVNDAGGHFVRAIGPGLYPPSPGLPASPYNNFNDYLTYLRTVYAPAHGNVVATIAGNFAGVGPSPTTALTKGQTYNYTVTIDAGNDLILTGSGSVAGAQTLLFKYADLAAPTGIYGANPPFYLNGAGTPRNPLNDLDGWITGDLLAGLNIGAVGSNVVRNGVQVGSMTSQHWFTLNNLFSGLQPNTNFYNQWAATLGNLSDAYNFAYSDRFAHVTAPLDPARVDTLELDIGGAAAAVSATWSVTTGGSWGVASNWTNATLPTNPGDTATFGTAITTAATIMLDTARGVGHLVFNSSIPYALVVTSTLTIDDTGGTGVADMTVSAGTHSVAVPLSLAGGLTIAPASGTSITLAGNVSGTGPLTKTGSGSLILSAGNNFTGGIDVAAGTLTLGTVAALPSFSPLKVEAGASLVNSPAAHTALTINGLTDSGTIDLTNLDAVVRGSGLSAVVALVTGRHLLSSTVSSDARHLTTLGIIQNNGLYGSATPAGPFDGFSPASTDVLVRYTYFGDANLDGKVDGSDYTLIDNTYNAEHSAGGAAAGGWFNGDFNYDGIVDGSDYTLIDSAFNTQAGNLVASALFAVGTNQIGAAASIPEPTSVAALALVSFALAGTTEPPRKSDARRSVD